MTQTNSIIKKDGFSRITVTLVAIFTLILYMVPFLYPLAYPFVLLSTLVHEMGHGIAAILVGGHFDFFKIWFDGSGVANIRGDFGALARGFVAAAGLLGPSIMAGFFFMNIKSERRSRIVLASFAIVLIISILLVVRNAFGICFVAGIAGLCFYFSLGQGKKYSQIVLAFLATQLALSVFSRSDYLFTKTAITSGGLMPSDVAQMAEALLLPYWFWGTVCGIFSLLILAFGIKRIFK